MSASGGEPAPRGSAKWVSTNKYRRVVATVNLPDDQEDWDSPAIIDQLKLDLDASYLVFGREVGDGTQRKHWQGYFEMEKQKKGAAILKIFRKFWPLPISVHLEKAMGPEKDNTKYCTKGGNAIVLGEPTGNNGQGSRTDVDGLFGMIKGGASMMEVAEANPHMFIQFGRGLREFKNMCTKHREGPRQLIFLWGPTGTGKTCHARELNPEPMNYTKSSGFMNGYSGENDAVLFDDFDWSNMDPKFWLQLNDRYPVTINIKGGEKKWNPSTIIYTSNDDPKSWWPDAPAATREAIHRRMDEYGEIRHLGTLVPHTETILTKFLRREAPVAAGVAAPPPPPPPGTPVVDADQEETQPLEYEPAAQPLQSPQIIDLTGDSDEEVISPNTGRVLFSAVKREEDSDTENERDRQVLKRRRN